MARHGERDCECQGYWSCGPSFTCPFLRKARRHGRLATRQSTNSRSPRFINTTVSSPKTVDVNGTTTPLRQKIRCSGNPSHETSVTMSRDSGPRTAALGPTPCSCSYRDSDYQRTHVKTPSSAYEAFKAPYPRFGVKPLALITLHQREARNCPPLFGIDEFCAVTSAAGKYDTTAAACLQTCDAQTQNSYERHIVSSQRMPLRLPSMHFCARRR